MLKISIPIQIGETTEEMYEHRWARNTEPCVVRLQLLYSELYSFNKYLTPYSVPDIVLDTGAKSQQCRHSYSPHRDRKFACGVLIKQAVLLTVKFLWDTQHRLLGENFPKG
jgi:hypothetical protein